MSGYGAPAFLNGFTLELYNQDDADRFVVVFDRFGAVFDRFGAAERFRNFAE